MSASFINANFKRRKPPLLTTLKLNKAQLEKSKPASSVKRSDEAIQNSKKPRTITVEGAEQKVAAAGDTLPIVFGKRSGSVGGVWVEPPLTKQGSYNFQGIFIYPISQGEIVSTPSATSVYVGPDQIQSSSGTLPTINKYYSSPSAMSSSKNTCPITSGKIFCDPDANYFISHVAKLDFTINQLSFGDFHTTQADLTIGSGDTSNTVIEHSGTNFVAWDSVTGTDVTSNFWTLSGLNPSTTTFTTNRNPATGTLIGGRTVGTIHRNTSAVDVFNIPVANSITYGGLYGTNNPVNIKFTGGTVNNQVNTSNPATTGTLGGVVAEYGVSTISDPTSPGASFDFTDYADITFLEVQGDIYDDDDPNAGEYKTTTRQLAVFIEEGVKVALYSAGTPGTTGASNQFVDLAMHLFALIGRVDGSSTADIASPIDTSNLQALASFNTNIGAFYNGIIEQSVNIIDYISTIAPFHLLQFVSENGRYSLKPLVPITAGNQIDGTALTPSATFTEANILPGSFRKKYDPAELRRDIQLSVSFRESQTNRIGLQKNRIVRFATVANDAPVEQIDMTDGCTSSAHVDLYAKYELAKRKHSTHVISFETPLLTSSLSILDVIKVQRQRKNSIGDDRTESDHYQVTEISHGSDGVTSISAMHFPLNGSGISLISNEILNGSFTTL
jgi:hypothetical protein|tara:strand:+ start:4482 stop:6494 length:2013 start_codon:yes stop_codon:yes gene_type:complete